MHSIKKINYVNEAYTQMSEMIASGVWVEGQKIPSETVLAKELNVSRVVIREALQRMRTERKIITRQGVGSFCANPNNFIDLAESGEGTVTDAEVAEFLQFREAVEYAVCCLAVRNRTEADLKVLEEDLQKMCEAEVDPISYTKADATFHYHIYCAAHNPYFIKAYNAVSDMMIRVLFKMNSIADAYTYSRKFHLQLFECIRDGRESDVIATMQNHDAYNTVRLSIHGTKADVQ